MGTTFQVVLGAWEEAKTPTSTLGQQSTRPVISEARAEENINDIKTKREKLATSLGVN